jgi:hypothetical protein
MTGAPKTSWGGNEFTALIFVILCGGGMVMGGGVGAAAGIDEPFVFPPPPTEILIAREHVIQGVWKDLTEYEESGEGHLTGKNTWRVTFGEKAKPINAIMKIEPIHVGLISQSRFHSDDLTLMWNVHISIL